MINNFQELMQKKKEYELTALLAYNEKTEKFGLSLTQEEAEELVASRNESLKEHQRIEFGEGILDKLIYVFCDSQYISQNNYLEQLKKLQDVFYFFKNECKDKLTDEELIQFMKEQYEDVCMGDIQYLADTCLVRLAQAVNRGYSGYKKSEGKGAYELLSEEKRWDKELYMQVIKELFWE